MKNIFLSFSIFLLINSCGNMGELHHDWTYNFNSTGTNSIKLKGYDTLTYRIIDNSDLLFIIYYNVDSLEPIEGINVHLSEIDSGGKTIRYIPIDSVNYYCIDSGEGGGEQAVSIDTNGISFKNITDSSLILMKLPGNKNMLSFYFHKSDSMPDFLHVSFTMKTRKQGKLKIYTQENDLTIERTEYRGSGGMGKLFCEKFPPSEKPDSTTIDNFIFPADMKMESINCNHEIKFQTRLF